MTVITNPNDVLTPDAIALPVADRTATFTTAAVTIPNGYDGILFTVIYGVIGDGTWTPSLTECATLGGTYTAVAAADISGTPPVGTSAADETTGTFYYHGAHGFVKLVMTETVASTTNLIAATATPLTEHI